MVLEGSAINVFSQSIVSLIHSNKLGSVLLSLVSVVKA